MPSTKNKQNIRMQTAKARHIKFHTMLLSLSCTGEETEKSQQEKKNIQIRITYAHTRTRAPILH